MEQRNCVNVFQGTSKWSANFQFKRSKVKVTGRQKPQENDAYLAYVFSLLTAAAHAPCASPGVGAVLHNNVVRAASMEVDLRRESARHSNSFTASVVQDNEVVVQDSV